MSFSYRLFIEMRYINKILFHKRERDISKMYIPQQGQTKSSEILTVDRFEKCLFLNVIISEFIDQKTIFHFKTNINVLIFIIILPNAI